MAAAGFCLYCGLLSMAIGLPSVAGQKIFVAHKPAYVKLRPDALPMRLSEVQDVLGLILGLHTLQDVHWNGLFSGNAFQRPRAAIAIVAEGAAGQTLSLHSDGMYAIETDDTMMSTFKLENRLRALYGQNALVVELSPQYKLREVQDEYAPLFDEVPSGKHAVLHSLRSDPDSVVSSNDVTALNISDPSYYHVLVELETTRHLLKKAGGRHARTTAVPRADLFSIYLDGFLKVANAHGFESDKTHNAWQLTENGVRKIVESARKAYNDDVVVVLLTLQPVAVTAEDRVLRSRKARSLLTVADASNTTFTNSSINLAPSYRPEYSAIFNIILWFCIIFFLVVVYVAFGVWHMDPGRESIIYRMTMQRIKKDN